MRWIVLRLLIVGVCVCPPISATARVLRNPISAYVADTSRFFASVNPLFANVYPLLKAGTRAPIVLPSTLAGVPDISRFTAELISVTSSAYSIGLTFEPRCSDSRCIEALINSYPEGGPIDLSILSKYQTVRLKIGDIAYFCPAQYRQSSTITWIHRRRRYVIAVTVNSYPKDLIRIANSMTKY
jgi:hypothetical protein